MGKKQQPSGPGNRRPGRPDSAPQRGGKPFNSSGGDDRRFNDRRGDERRSDDRRPDDRRSDERRPSFGRREGGNDFPSRPPFGRPAGGNKPGGFGKGPGGSRPFGGGNDRRPERFGDDRRDARSSRPYQKPAEPDDAADFMRGRLNKPDFRKSERPEGDNDAPRRSFERRGDDQERPRRSFGGDRPGGFGGNRPSFGGPRGGQFGDREQRFGNNDRREERPARRFNDGDTPRPARGSRGPGNEEQRGFGRRFGQDEQRPERGVGRFGDREQRFGNNDRRDERPAGDKPRFGGDKPSFGGEGRFERPERGGDRPARFGREERPERGERPSRFGREDRPAFGRASRPEGKQRGNRFGQDDEMKEAPSYKNLQFYEEDKSRGNKRRRDEPETDGSIRLNRYIANAGVCSRREADQLIEAGEIRVNGEVVTELGYKVQPSDTVHYGKTNLKREKLVYVLLNKPKDFLTTTDDPDGRKTVMDLVKNASKERIFPVGRLDRNTTGLLLFTNDGEVAQKLSHPSHRNKKVYQVELDKDLTEEHLAQIAAGIELEDGKAEVDDVAMVAGNPRFVGIEIHIGRNRIVRRIFEHLGYDVKALDRVQYAGLTKKDLPRGQWRYLNEKEVIRLKYFM